MRRSLLRLERKPSEALQRLKSDPVPSGEIDAGGAVDDPHDNEGVLERSRIVGSAQARMPYVGLTGKYNKRWYVDAVTLPHNSMRTLLSKLFGMVISVNRIALDMSSEDFSKLFAFISQLYRYIRALLEAEEKILYPMVESGLRRVDEFSPIHPLHPLVRVTSKDRMVSLLVTLIDEGKSNYNDNVQKAGALQMKLDKFTGELLEYFRIKEKLLPRIVATSIRGMRERNRMEHLLIKFFTELGEEYYYSALLAIPLQVKEVRDDFINRHFKNAKKKELFLAAVRNVDESLFGVVNAFERASKKYQSRFSMQEFLSHYGHAESNDGEENLTI